MGEVSWELLVPDLLPVSYVFEVQVLGENLTIVLEVLLQAQEFSHLPIPYTFVGGVGRVPPLPFNLPPPWRWLLD